MNCKTFKHKFDDGSIIEYKIIGGQLFIKKPPMKFAKF